MVVNLKSQKMRRNELKLSEIIRDFKNQKSLKAKLLDKQLEDEWLNLYPKLKEYTQWVRYREGELQVSIQSAVLRNELNLHKQRIIEQMNVKLNGVCELKDFRAFG